MVVTVGCQKTLGLAPPLVMELSGTLPFQVSADAAAQSAEQYRYWSAPTFGLVPDAVVVAVTSAMADPAGTVAVHDVADEHETPVATNEPNLIVVAPPPVANLAPEIDTVFPPPVGPAIGETAVTEGKTENAGVPLGVPNPVGPSYPAPAVHRYDCDIGGVQLPFDPEVMSLSAARSP